MLLEITLAVVAFFYALVACFAHKALKAHFPGDPVTCVIAAVFWVFTAALGVVRAGIRS